MQVDVTPLEKKSLKEARAEYDDVVISQMPGDAALRKEMKALRKELKESQALAHRLADQIVTMSAERETGKTRVYIENREGVVTTPEYLPDGQWDNVFFQWSDRGFGQRWGVRMNEDGVLIVRTDTMGDDMVIAPRSSNEIEVRMIKR